jgi:hypothetical protein
VTGARETRPGAATLQRGTPADRGRWCVGSTRARESELDGECALRTAALPPMGQTTRVAYGREEATRGAMLVEGQLQPTGLTDEMRSLAHGT